MAHIKERYECTTGGHSKFWEIELDGIHVIVCWGKIGSGGRSQNKAFTSESRANIYVIDKRLEKLDKGYTIVSAQDLSIQTSPPKKTRTRRRKRRSRLQSKSTKPRYADLCQCEHQYSVHTRGMLGQCLGASCHCAHFVWPTEAHKISKVKTPVLSAEEQYLCDYVDGVAL